MKLLLLLPLFSLALFALTPNSWSLQRLDRKESPFEALRWAEDQPEVRLDETWYRPLAIHGVEVERILAFCGRQWPGQTQKRFGEDLVEALDRMGHLPPQKVELKLERLADGKVVTLTDVPMSAANRNSIRNSGDGERPRGRRTPRTPAELTRADARADLDEMAARLEDQFAYLHLRGIDLRAELDALAAGLPDPVPTAQLADELNRLLLRFGDGHAGVSSEHQRGSTRYAQVLLFDAEGGVVAVRPDRSDFVDPERPFVRAIDGEPLEVCLEAMKPFVTAGSPQLVRFRSLVGLSDIEALRRVRGKPESDELQLTLGAASETEARTVAVAMTKRPPRFEARQTPAQGRLAGDIGYVRIGRMNDDLIPELHRKLAELRDTRGLIVDVRGNGGGSRGLLLALAGYLTDPEEGPWIGNVAAYRLSPRFDDDHLEARFMVPLASSRWNEARAAAIRAVAASFEPEWPLPEGFSAWHYLVLGPTGAESEYFYDRPVVVLADAGCFSATDIFLGALAGRPRVTLLGQASGGGSARSQGFTLPKSGIAVRCASMASFRPDGRLYDGRGIEVDVEVLPAPSDFLAGGGDRVLEAALDRLREH